MANAVICPETGKSLKHQELITKLRYKIKWMRSTANKINRLYNTDTIRFIRRSNIPKGRKVTDGSFVVDIKEHKGEKERTRLTVGGDPIEYPGDKSTRTAGLTTSKISSTVLFTPWVSNSLSWLQNHQLLVRRRFAVFYVTIGLVCARRGSNQMVPSVFVIVDFPVSLPVSNLTVPFWFRCRPNCWWLVL
jgi:hypothetical protein